MTAPARALVSSDSAPAALALLAAVVALVWAGSPWSESYGELWSIDLTIGAGRFSITEDLRHWVNEALMAVFFFVVGLEIARERREGDLQYRATATVPVAAAVGGMVVPVVLYIAIVGNGPGSAGWAIPMATDIAFAVSMLAILGSRVPSTLRLFLLTLAVVDDIGAVIVIAVVYSDDIDVRWLCVAAGTVVVGILLRRARRRAWPLYAVIGAVMWVAMHASGVHATIAGVVMGLLVPGVTAERLERRVYPWTSLVVIPLFALANAGVSLSLGALEPAGAGAVVAGTTIGLVVGKPLGITFATWLAVRLGLGRLPEGSTWRQLIGVAGLAGIGFTVSLFIAGLAFSPGDGLEQAAKTGIIAGSVASAIVGWAVLATGRTERMPPVGRPKGAS